MFRGRLSGGLRYLFRRCRGWSMTALPSGRLCVGRRLIDHAEVLDRILPGRRIGAVRHFEGVKTSAMHEKILIAQDITDGTDFTFVAVTLPQDSRVGTPSSA